MRKDLKKCVVTEPFLNLVLTCLNGEEKQRDGLVGSMLKQYRNSSFTIFKHFFVLLCISLVGGIFDLVCHPSICNTSMLFQLMLYGVISKGRDGYLFDSSYDMLSTVLQLNESAIIPELLTSPQKFGKSQSQGQIIQTTVKANRHRLQIYTVKRQEQVFHGESMEKLSPS
uniref:Uncharacterized protein n=1 Tax=Wuchereria bancrofti TaxID=6293 RepID=A0A1I8EIF2_WUCBA